MLGNTVGVAFIICALYAPVWLPSICVTVLVVMEFLFYRDFVSYPPLSPPALRGHLLTPEWRTYFRQAVLVFSALSVYHGLFASLVQYVSVFLAFTWVLGISLTSFIPVCFNMALISRIHFILFLPDYVFENGAIDHEAVRRIRRKKRRSIL